MRDSIRDAGLAALFVAAMFAAGYDGPMPGWLMDWSVPLAVAAMAGGAAWFCRWSKGVERHEGR